MSSPVTVEDRGEVCVVRLDDGKANVLTLETIELLGSALGDAAGSGAVVLAGREGCLSAGLDRGVMTGGDRAARSQVLRAVTELYQTMMTLPAPLVVACTGHAIAAGAVLLLVADERFAASATGRIGLTEVQVGVPLPPLAMAVARARIVPNHLARATLGAALLSPEAALTYGYVDELHPPDEVVHRAVERAAYLGTLRAAAYLASRELLWAPVLAEIDAARSAQRERERGSG